MNVQVFLPLIFAIIAQGLNLFTTSVSQKGLHRAKSTPIAAYSPHVHSPPVVRPSIVHPSLGSKKLLISARVI